MADPAATEARIAQARDRLTAKLAELQHRVTTVKALVSPRTYLENPWVQLGVGAVVGYLVGRVPASRRLMPGPAVAPASAPQGMIAATLRGTLIALASAVVKRAIAEAMKSRAAAPP